MRLRGYAWAGASIMLVSLAQILMKLGMMALPGVGWRYFSLAFVQQYAASLFVVSLGIMGYVFSLACWLLALRDLPLNRAYPLLSLSYVLVYLAAIFLPWLHETASWNKNLGVMVILAGVWLIGGAKQRQR